MKRYVSFFKSHKMYESIKWQYVIRDGQRVKKPISNNPDMRIECQSPFPKGKGLKGDFQEQLVD